MSQHVQELIDKIKNEGVQAADQKAKEIEDQANKKAEEILANANREAEQIIVNAKEEVKKMQESTHMALRQSSRDTLLSLRKEIENTLHKIINNEVSDALTSDTLAEIIAAVAKGQSDGKSSDDIIVSLNNKDQEKLKSGFMSKLQKQVKQSIKIQSSDDIGKGFTISFDSGKSSFDFTDESLAEYLGTFLNAQVADLVGEASQFQEKEAVRA